MHCEKCSYTTTFKQRFDLHLQSKKHLEEKPEPENYHCEKCDYTTTVKQRFDLHLQSKKHLEEKPENYHCDKCDYTTTVKQRFEAHLQSKKHLEEKKTYTCKYCNAGRYKKTFYVTKQQLDRHLDTNKHKSRVALLKHIKGSSLFEKLKLYHTCEKEEPTNHERTILRKYNNTEWEDYPDYLFEKD
jgi:Zn finger protein HypA/HybF involved in hydrogenase expression